MESNDIIIEHVTDASQVDAETIGFLAQQEGKNYKELTEEEYLDLLASPNTFLYIAKVVSTGQIVGMVTLVTYRIPYVRKAYLEDLVVDAEFRGRGIGSLLTQKIVDEARAKGAAYLDFTSRPRREEGNSLYEKMGFQKREANVYRLIIDYGEV